MSTRMRTVIENTLKGESISAFDAFSMIGIISGTIVANIGLLKILTVLYEYVMYDEEPQHQYKFPQIKYVPPSQSVHASPEK